MIKESVAMFIFLVCLGIVGLIFCLLRCSDTTGVDNMDYDFQCKLNGNNKLVNETGLLDFAGYTSYCWDLSYKIVFSGSEYGVRTRYLYWNFSEENTKDIITIQIIRIEDGVCYIKPVYSTEERESNFRSYLLVIPVDDEITELRVEGV